MTVSMRLIKDTDIEWIHPFDSTMWDRYVDTKPCEINPFDPAYNLSKAHILYEEFIKSKYPPITDIIWESSEIGEKYQYALRIEELIFESEEYYIAFLLKYT